MSETGVPPGRADPGGPEDRARFVVEAARWAPSVHNTQPWQFGVKGARISLRADPDRKLGVADPSGREMLISCGAALATLRLAMRRLGYRPRVRSLPDPDRPHLLADVEFGDTQDEVDEDLRRLYEQIRSRRTHRGAFNPDPVSAGLLTMLRDEARAEGAMLQFADDADTAGALAALTQAAQCLHRLNVAYARENARWAPAPGSHRAEGVHAFAYPRETVHTEPHFPGRDFARGLGQGVPVPEDDGGSQTGVTGVVALLTTERDGPADWLRAGQALQRVLLRAGVEQGLSAAFHTQALEVPELREFIGTRFCAGHHPQMLLRLGVAGGDLGTVRRPVDEVIDEEP